MRSANRNRNWIWMIAILLGIILIASFYGGGDDEVEQISLSEIASWVEEEKVEEIVVKDNQVTATIQNVGKVETYKEDGVGLSEYGITPEKVKITVEDTTSGTVWIGVLSTLLPLLLIGAFFWFMLRGISGQNNKAMGFGKSSARLSVNRKTTFNDVAGLIEPKQELKEVVEFLKTPKKFRDLGAEIPKGVLLVGPPGTGKTLLAKAVAGEARVPFFSISASEFVEMFVGVGASRVRDLFLKAKRNAPAIIFVDELDAIGRQRGSGLGGSHDEREQTLNQILVEMDGFETKDNVIIMAATNRPDVLDPALLRPGRFDRQVVIDLPDKIEREAILKLHLENKPSSRDVNLSKVASSTPGFSGADLRNITNEAAILAARNNQKNTTQKNLEEALEKVMLGPERKSRALSEEEKEITAAHEAGHAVVSHVLPNADPVHKVSIVSRGMALGFTWNIPEKDQRLKTKVKFEDEISSLLGGRVAEEEFFGKDHITTGAQNDLKKATLLARQMVVEYGMSEKLGPQTYGHKESMPFLGKEISEQRNYSEDVAKLIDEEVSQFIRNGRKKARDIILKHKSTIKKLAQKLLKVETLTEKELDQVLPKHIVKAKL